MALRVLLADNSESIRKVIQLSLQDFAVEVKTVALGVDVLEIAKNFKPDIIFADILLQRKNGYEVSYELKSNPDLTTVPIILMWSNFMEIDANKFNACKANDKIEKPFDSETLRNLVRKWVPKAKTSPLAAHLVMPKGLPTAPAAPGAPAGSPAPAAPVAPTAPVAPAAPKAPVAAAAPQPPVSKAASQPPVPAAASQPPSLPPDLPQAPPVERRTHAAATQPAQPAQAQPKADPAAFAPPFQSLPGQGSDLPAEDSNNEPGWSMDSFDDIQKYESPEIPEIVSPAEMERDMLKGRAPEALPDLELELPDDADDFQIHSMQAEAPKGAEDPLQKISRGPQALDIHETPRELDLDLSHVGIEMPPKDDAPPKNPRAIDPTSFGTNDDEPQEWEQSPADRFAVSIPKENTEIELGASGDDPVQADDFVYAPLDAKAEEKNPAVPMPPAGASSVNAATVDQLVQSQIEKLLPEAVNKAAAEIIQRWVEQHLPDYAIQSIQAELDRLMADSPPPPGPRR